MMIVAAVGAAGLLSPGPVDATGHSATRSFSATSVIVGGTVEVTIEVADYGQFGGVTETLPDGFGYVSSNLSDAQVETDGQDVTFALFGEDSFSYTVRAPDTLGAHTFHGVVKDNVLDSNEVGGDSDVMVMASGLEASRSFSSSTVDAGGELTVTITAAAYGQFGQVVETLPTGFGYVSTSLPDPPWVSGQMLGFSLFGEESFTYTVTASRTLGAHDFSGVVKDEARMETAIGADSTVTVQAATASHSAVRSVDSRVEAGAEVVVTIDLEGLGGFGQVRETLPEGFAYVSSSLPDDQVASADGMLTFTILRDDSFTYTVTASGHVEGEHALSGEAVNDVRASASIGGAASIAVGSTVVASDGGNVMLTVTPDAQSTYFKGRIVEGCEGGPEDTEVALCATVDAWDAQGEEIVDFALDAPSTLTLTLTAEQVTELGGSETLTALHEAGGVMVYASSADGWTALEAEAAFGEDGSVTLTTSITAFGDVAVTLDRALLPSTGGVTPPSWLMLFLALAGAAMIPTGVLVLRRIRA